MVVFGIAGSVLKASKAFLLPISNACVWCARACRVSVRAHAARTPQSSFRAASPVPSSPTTQTLDLSGRHLLGGILGLEGGGGRLGIGLDTPGRRPSGRERPPWSPGSRMSPAEVQGWPQAGLQSRFALPDSHAVLEPGPNVHVRETLIRQVLR